MKAIKYILQIDEIDDMRDADEEVEGKYVVLGGTVKTLFVTVKTTVFGLNSTFYVRCTHIKPNNTIPLLKYSTRF